MHTNVTTTSLVSFSSINAHGINAVAMCVDMVLNDIELVPSHVIFMVLGVLLYIVVTWARRAQDSLQTTNNSWLVDLPLAPLLA